MIQLQGKSKIISEDEILQVFRVDTQEVDGKPVQTTKLCFKIMANVQPVMGLDLLMVPEGDRFREQFHVYTNEIQKPVQVNDRISRNGINYQVQHVETWGDPPNGYQKLRMMRIDVGPNTSPDPGT